MKKLMLLVALALVAVPVALAAKPTTPGSERHAAARRSSRSSQARTPRLMSATMAMLSFASTRRR